MKKITATIMAVLFTAYLAAQAPQKISYQAVVRNSSDLLVKNQSIGMRISILKGSLTGTSVYSETHTPTTNTNGLITVEIGGGPGFSSIDWSMGTYFLKTEIDPSGGTNYTITAASQLLSVPYAMYSNTTGLYNETDPVFVASPANGITGSNITNWNTAYTWGNHDGLYRASTWVPAWSDVMDKPVLSAVATSGSYNDLSDIPSLPDATWTNLTGKPSTLSGFGITDAMTTSHVANGITSGMISDWNTSYSWGDHAGLYRPLAWVPSWSDVTGKPVTIAGYGITDAMSTSHVANGITSGMISNWNTSYGWGNHSSAGYVSGTRTLTINGTVFDLTSNRSWSVGTVTSVGLSLPAIFSVSGSPVTGTGSLSASLVPQSAGAVFASPAASPGTPAFRSLVSSDIPGLDWNKIVSGKPTTLAGYGIADGVNTTGNQSVAGEKTFTGSVTVPSPVNGNDAVTKDYVDALLTQIQQLQSQPGVLKDYEGNLYTTVRIGDQVWMGENLKTTRYRNGDPIPLVSDPTAWGNSLTPAYCWYNNDAANKNLYGALYNWHAVNTAMLCPAGWHVPSDADWIALSTSLGGEGVAGGKLKETGTVHWISPNTNATNESGFTALPGGYRNYFGTFSGSTGYCYWWCSTEYDSILAWYIMLYYNAGNVLRTANNKKDGFYVRCVRD